VSAIVLDTSADMEAFGRWLATQLRAGDVVVLTGPLGAGKTTLTRGLGEGLGVVSPVQSPTFIVAREHERVAPGSPPLVHVDAYRLGSAVELDDLDIDWSSSISVIEWGRPYVSAVARSWLDIDITSAGHVGDSPDDTGDEDVPRFITVTAHPTAGVAGDRLHTIAEAAHDFGH
jgi:tRNA threonylcarbamoyladenosine biosynthesis protein TsaE